MRKNFNLDRANRRFFMCATKPHFNSNKSHKTFRKHTISSHWELDNGKMVFSFFFFDIFEWMWIDNEPQDSRHCLSLKRLGRLLKTATQKKRTKQTTRYQRDRLYQWNWWWSLHRYAFDSALEWHLHVNSVTLLSCANKKINDAKH